MERLSFFGAWWRCALIFVGTSAGLWVLVLSGFPGSEEASDSLAHMAIGYTAFAVLVSPLAAWGLRYRTVKLQCQDQQRAGQLLAESVERMGYSLGEKQGSRSTFTLDRGFGPFRWPIHIVEEEDGSSVSGPSSTVWLLLRRFRAAERK